MQSSENLNELAAALAKAQGAMKNASKDADNPYFKSKYATLAECWNVARAPLAANGLSVLQSPTVDVDDKGRAMVLLETVLIHSSGQAFSNTIKMPVSKPDAQGIGSAITYARRYALSALVGIASEDDDGEGCVSHDAPAPKKSRSLAAAGSKSVREDIPEISGEPEPMPDMHEKLRTDVKNVLIGAKGLGLKKEEVGPYIRKALGREDIGGGLKAMAFSDLQTVMSVAQAELKQRMEAM